MSGIAAALVIAIAVGLAAGVLSRLAIRSGTVGALLFGLLGALGLRLAGLGGIAVLVHLRWPDELLKALAAAALVLVLGLALDARHLLRTLRRPNEERVRA